MLQLVAGRLSWCTRNTYSDSDTDNLGRCILHAMDQPCVSSLQVRLLPKEGSLWWGGKRGIRRKCTLCLMLFLPQGQQYNSYRLREDVDVVSHLQLVGGSSLVKECVTVSNVPEATDMFPLHMYFLQVILLYLWFWCCIFAYLMFSSSCDMA